MGNFRKHGVQVGRDQWLEQAVIAEQGDSLMTCRAIVKETIDFGIIENDDYMDEKEKKRVTRQTWLENIDALEKQGAIETAKSLIMNAIALDSGKKSLWMRAQKLEQDYGTTDSLCKLLQTGAMTAKHEFLFILYAKLLWKKLGRESEALEALRQGLEEHTDSEDLVIALQKLLREVGKFAEAQKVLQKAIDGEVNTERV